MERDLQKQLNRIEHVRAYGEDLGLPLKNAFKKIDTSTSTPYWCVFSSYPDRLEPYNNIDCGGGEDYNSKDEAMMRNKELREEGLHTRVLSFQAIAIKSCKITKELIEADAYRQAESILHEGFHLLLQDKGIIIPLEIEEALTDAFGDHCCQVYFQEYEPRFLSCAQRREKKWLQLATFLRRTYYELEAYYQNPTNGLDAKLIAINKELKRRHKKKELIRQKTVLNNADYVRDRPYFLHANSIRKILKKNDILMNNIIIHPQEIITLIQEEIPE